MRTDSIDAFNAEHQREATDLSMHAIKQVLDLLTRTMDLTDSKLGKTIIAKNVCLATLSAHAVSLKEAANEDDAHPSFDLCMRWALEQLHKDATNFMALGKKEAKKK